MKHKLSFENINKSFPGVKALSDISFSAESGRVLALMGENGAGKSTLLKILSGDLQADSGRIVLDGEEQRFISPHDALKKGVGVIYQERQLLPSMSVMENIFIGDLPATRLKTLNRKKLRRDARQIIDAFGLDLDPDAPVGSLSIAHQQMVEIMKAYRRNSTVLAFDEPTAPLTDTEIEILFRLIGQLKEQGKIIIYISHRLPEVFKLSDEIVVLKDGKFVKRLITAETDERELIRSMVGREIGDTYSGLSRNSSFGDPLLELKDISTNFLHNVSITVHAGEIVGLAGLVGSGRTEVANAVFGIDRITGGEIKLSGKPVSFKSPYQAIEAGIALCPEDRKEQGLVLWRSIMDNVCMPVLGQLKKGLFLNRHSEEELTEAAIKRYSIKTPSVNKTVIELSGGNQQKVILGRWTSDKINTKLLILDEPTKGIDVGTKAEIYQMICDFAKQGMGIIFISSELPEVINVADNIVVMRSGHVAGKLSRSEANEENIMTLAMLDMGRD